MTSPIQATGIHKSFRQGGAEVPVLAGVEFALQPGERVALVGRSGSGKSTLLHILAGLEDSDAGDVVVQGRSLSQASADERAGIRNAYMGFIYQLHHLLPEFTALENVAMPLRLAGVNKAEALERAATWLDYVALGQRLQHRPSALSGGERQRVAVARALVANPAVVLADEPTGSLDQDNAAQVMKLMQELCAEHGASFLIATHDQALAAEMDRVLTLERGVLRP